MGKKAQRWYYVWSPTKGAFTSSGEFSKTGRPDLFRSPELVTHWIIVQKSFHVKFPKDVEVLSFAVGSKPKVTSSVVEILRKEAERDPKLKRAVERERRLQADVCVCGHAREHHDTACWFGHRDEVCGCAKFRKSPKRKICVIQDCRENRVGDSIWCLTHRTRKEEGYD